MLIIEISSKNFARRNSTYLFDRLRMFHGCVKFDDKIKLTYSVGPFFE